MQMALLEPLFSVLDETDSGLDIDALKIVGEGVEALKTRSVLLWSSHTINVYRLCHS